MPAASSTNLNSVTVRQARPQDGQACGRICYDAFSAISSAHGFPSDFPSAEVASGVLSMIFSTPGFHAVVAEIGDRIVGSNAIDLRAIIAGIGPITVDPAVQNLGVGRKLMDAVMDVAKEHGVAGTRLAQAAFHNRSLSLYTTLGFDIREPLACIQGTPPRQNVSGYSVRRAQPDDIAACNALSRRIHGFDRGADLAHSIETGTATVVEREGRITGYATQLAFFGHATAETNPDLQSMIAAAESFGGPGILVPSRNSDLLRWCLRNGLRVVEPLTLMSTGLYQHPSGAWLPSILF